MRSQLKWKFPRKCSPEYFKTLRFRSIPLSPPPVKTNQIKGVQPRCVTISMNHLAESRTFVFYCTRTCCSWIRCSGIKSEMHRICPNKSQLPPLPTAWWLYIGGRYCSRNYCVGHSSRTRIIFLS